MDLRNALENRLQLQLSSTLVFDFPTATAMADHISTLQQLAPEAALAKSQQMLPSEEGGMLPPTATCALVRSAIHRLAGGAPTATRAAASDACMVLPLQRWDAELGAPRAAASAGQADPQQVRFMHLLEGVQSFDAALFSTSGAEAALMDPQQRVLLECVAEGALTGSDGGSAFTVSQRASCGVYVGCSWMDYGRLMKMTQGVTPYSATGGYRFCSLAACTFPVNRSCTLVIISLL